MRALILLLAATLPMAGQEVKKIFFFGSGVSSSLVNGTKSVSAIGGFKLSIRLSDSWVVQPFCGISFVDPQAAGAKAWWSVQPGMMPGYRLRHGRSRFALLAGPVFSRNKAGDFLPSAIYGPSIRLKGKWVLLLTGTRSSQSWGIVSATFGRSF